MQKNCRNCSKSTFNETGDDVHFLIKCEKYTNDGDHLPTTIYLANYFDNVIFIPSGMTKKF